MEIKGTTCAKNDWRIIKKIIDWIKSRKKENKRKKTYLASLKGSNFW